MKCIHKLQDFLHPPGELLWFFQSSFMSDKNWNSYVLRKRRKKGRLEFHLVGLQLVFLGSPSITVFLFSDFMEELWLWMYTVLNTNSGRTVNCNNKNYITVIWVVKNIINWCFSPTWLKVFRDKDNSYSVNILFVSYLKMLYWCKWIGIVISILRDKMYIMGNLISRNKSKYHVQVI